MGSGASTVVEEFHAEAEEEGWLGRRHTKKKKPTTTTNNAHHGTTTTTAPHEPTVPLEATTSTTGGTARDQLARACGLYDRGRSEEARAIAARIERWTAGDSGGLSLAHAFAAALAHRGNVAKGALYERDTSVWQLDLFQASMERLVVLDAYSAVVAAAVARELVSHAPLTSSSLDAQEGALESAVLVDIGIGEGAQEAVLFDVLAEQQHHQQQRCGRRQLKRLHVIGFDLTAESLAVAETAVRGKAATTLGAGVEVDFAGHSGRVEDCPAAVWQSIRAAADADHARVVLLCSLSLHHTDPAIRDALLGGIANALQPDAFVLGEPHIDHATQVLAARFRSSWRHFSLVWGMLEIALPSADERRPVADFFGREIEDAFANADSARTEREELLPEWLRRLHRVGFEPEGVSSLEPLLQCIRTKTRARMASSGVSLALHTADGSTVSADPASTPDQPAWLGIDFRDDTVLGIMVARLQQQRTF